MATPQAHPESPRKSTKITLAVLGVLSIMVVGYCAVADDDDEVTADCVQLVDDDAQDGDFAGFVPTGSATPSASPSPTITTSSSSDGSYQVVDDSYCDDDDGSGTTGRSYYGGSHGAYVWYYGGHRVGNRIKGGTTLRPSDVTISSRSGKSIQRGGFGRSWSSGG